MKLYDDLINKTNLLLLNKQAKTLPVCDLVNYPTTNQTEMVLKSDSAYELGDQKHNGMSLTLLSDTLKLNHDEIVLYGNDLNEINENTNYARICLIKVKENLLGEGDALYKAIKAIDYVKYHINLKGIMLRSSTINKKESLRVSKDALKDGINFEILGNTFINRYKKNKMIEQVKIIFVNTDDFDYQTLSNYVKHADTITNTIDHMLNNILMDCHSCNLQEVCDEVEGLKELHFSIESQSKA